MKRSRMSARPRRFITAAGHARVISGDSPAIKATVTFALSKRVPVRRGFIDQVFAVVALIVALASSAGAQTVAGSPSASPLITQAIDATQRVTLAGNTRPEATAQYDRGAVPDDFPMLAEIKEHYANDLFDGGSGIVGPDGNWIAGPVVGREEVLVADIDPHTVNEERMMFDVAGHYSRPDVFESRVNRTRQRAAVFDNES